MLPFNISDKNISNFNISDKNISNENKRFLNQKCIICGKKEIINSHTIPRKNLNLITSKDKQLVKIGWDDFNIKNNLKIILKNKKIKNINLTKWHQLCIEEKIKILNDKDTLLECISYNQAQTFSLICNSCDNKIFENYEKKLNIDNNDILNIILNEIFMKFILYVCSTGISETKYLQMSLLSVLSVLPKNIKKRLDKKDAFCKEMIYLLNNNLKKNKNFELFFYEKLNYKVQFSALYGFKMEIFNEFFNIKNDNISNGFFVNILPQENSTIILCFAFSDISKILKENTKNISNLKMHDFIMKSLIGYGVLYCNPQYANDILKYSKDLYMYRILKKIEPKSFFEKPEDYKKITSIKDKDLSYLLTCEFNTKYE